MRPLDLAGQKFGKLSVIALMPQVGPKRRWICACDCGGATIVTASKLTSGNTVSCGCKRRKHGHSYANGKKAGSSEYNSWRCMITRCLNRNDPSYPRWGGRGITVCSRWKCFEFFLEDMGPKPTLKHSIHRINSNGNYEPSNCKWATPKEQNAHHIGMKASLETRAKMSMAQTERWRKRKVLG